MLVYMLLNVYNLICQVFQKCWVLSSSMPLPSQRRIRLSVTETISANTKQYNVKGSLPWFKNWKVSCCLIVLIEWYSWIIIGLVVVIIVIIVVVCLHIWSWLKWVWFVAAVSTSGKRIIQWWSDRCSGRPPLIIAVTLIYIAPVLATKLCKTISNLLPSISISD